MPNAAEIVVYKLPSPRFFSQNLKLFLCFCFVSFPAVCGATQAVPVAAEAAIHLQLRTLELSSNFSGSCRARFVKSCVLLRSSTRRTGGDLTAPQTTNRPPQPAL